MKDDSSPKGKEINHILFFLTERIKFCVCNSVSHGLKVNCNYNSNNSNSIIRVIVSFLAISKV